MEALSLVARKLFDKGDDSNDDSDNVCPPENTGGPEIVPIFGDMTFHSFAGILSGACAIFSSLIIIFVILRHATCYTNPVQQRQVLRVLLLVPWVSLFSFLIVWQEEAGEYLIESLDFGCAIALSAFLLLLCDYILSHPDGFDELFGQGAWTRGQFAGDSPQWFKRVWYLVLQFIPTSLIIWVATCITLAAGVYCKTSNSTHFAHIWITVFKFLVTGVAIAAVLRFYGRLKPQLKEHNVFLKLMSFKGIIGLNALQIFIINLLVTHETIKPTSHLSYRDLQTALPSLLLACEMPIFAILLFFAFPVAPYQNNGRAPAHGPLVALWHAFNVSDIFSAFLRGPMRLVREQQRGLIRQDSVKLGMGGGSSIGGGGAPPPPYPQQEQGVERRYDDPRMV
ncbi:hypothetical protein BS50DRAFT_569796 [Corynespora cassiicola Philippines]|uniref:DUF300-domain-containing protein n=1 Tax=Corynespora cassiicola Philippines TaxID=1448308 RepID=A0A2T2P3M2_CORCC|nr:hypothetical protein BS50DRAFT_569796 [Corynespora cassiicola Philippines]